MNRWINGYIFPKMMLYVLTTVLLAVLIGIMCIFIAKIEDLEKDIETKLAVMKYSLGTYVLGLDQQEGNYQKIAFYACTNKLQKNLARHQSVMFESALTNVGNCYHQSSGIFIPSISGVYVFDVQIVNCYYGYEFVTELVVDGITKALHYSSDSSFCSSGGGGITTVYVNAGNSVWVRVHSTNGYNEVSWGSTFSGFLLYPDFN